MSTVLYVVSFVLIFFSIVGILCLCYLAHHTENITEFLCVCNWFGKYTKISQRIYNQSVVDEIQGKYKNMPIREQIAEYGRLFEEDFSMLFEKLHSGIHYRVVTHYSALMEQAAANGKIRLLSPPVKLKRRTLRELKPLLGRQDYRLAKSCIMHCPHLKRCCEKCKRRSVCKCKRGGICPKGMDKAFVRYDFTIER